MPDKKPAKVRVGPYEYRVRYTRLREFIRAGDGPAREYLIVADHDRREIRINASVPPPLRPAAEDYGARYARATYRPAA